MPDISTYGKVIFDRETSSTVFEILQKYNLNENPDEVFNKLEKGEPLNGNSILTIVEEIVLGITQKENLTSLIENRLKIPRQIAEEMAMGVREKLLLGARKATQEEIAALEIESENEVESISESSNLLTKPQKESNSFAASPIEPIKAALPLKLEPAITESQTPTNQPPIIGKKDDAYREPIN